MIEMTGVNYAADIWSLGSTVIELMTMHPPYFDQSPMSAMFRIANDEHPPIPDICSPLLKDFLLQCFAKDSSKRPTATQLLEHEWLSRSVTLIPSPVSSPASAN